MIIYEYTVDIEADVSAKEAFDAYVNPLEMKRWQPHLVDIIHQKGKLFEQGSEGVLVYQNGEQEMMMHVHVQSCENQVFDAIYEVPGVFNQTTEYFSDHDGKLHWKSVVEFKFDAPSVSPKAVFEVGTKQGMLQFIEYLKSHKNKG